MRNLRRLTTVALGLVAGSALFGASLQAQIAEVSRTAIADQAQITFGYLCDDRFVIRNDGTKPITLAYGLEKGNEHTSITMNAREEVELASKSKASMELWMDGKVIARAEKDKVSCKDVVGSAAANVTPLNPGKADGSQRVVFGPAYPFYDPWYFGFYGSTLMYRPYLYGGINVPIIIRRPVFVRGGGGRRR
jgi:hypothetical protein